jgi:hypothetical protein
MVPSPDMFDGFVGSINVLNVDGTDFIKTTELGSSSRSSLKPDDERYGMVLPV